MGNIPLPPWLRRWQQTWYYQALLVPFIVGYGGFLIAGGCLSNGLFAMHKECLESAFSGFAVSLVTVFITGKSVGSPSFNTDGTSNTTVANVVTVQKAAEANIGASAIAADAITKRAGMAAAAVKTP